jgi:DNA excision repair protein ERCC-4
MRSALKARMPPVVVDCREQRPYRFGRSVCQRLESGDYSLQGFEGRVAVERKSKTDAYSSLGRSRERFQREMERLSALDYAAIVVEASLADFLVPPVFSRLSPNSAICSLLAWSVLYGVHVFFVGNRRHGNNVTRQLLEKYWLYHGETAHG